MKPKESLTMPWKDVDMMTLRQEFTALAQQEGVNFSALCTRFGISRKTGYKWLERSIAQGPAGLQDRSRRPCNTPLRASQASEELVVAMRLKHPTWGGRKIHHRLLNQGHIQVPPTQHHYPDPAPTWPDHGDGQRKQHRLAAL
jgi:hypothetical protein